MLTFCLLWISWCALHSFLIDPSVVGYVESNYPRFFVLYRIFYNLFSFVTLLPLCFYSAVNAGDGVFIWTGIGQIFRGFLICCSLALFYGGAKRYDLKSFLGIRQLQERRSRVLLGKGQDFSATGVFGMTRHPWYLGSLLFSWSVLPVYHQKTFAVACILSVYLVVGTLLEERKILKLYGESYSKYQKQVSMLIPWKWLAGCFRS